MVAATGSTELSPGCRLVPIVPGESGSPVRFCAVVQTGGADKGTAQLILLHSLVGGRVYLGALTDRGGAVREWLELWVQSVSGLHGTVSASEGAFTNVGLDRRWREMTSALAKADSGACWETGWESRHPAPV